VLLITVAPACWLVVQPSSVELLSAYVMVGAGLGLSAPSTFLSELFPTRLRYSGLSLTYGVGTAVVGGLTPLIATALVESRDTLAPMAGAMVVLLALAVLSLLLARETAPAADSPSLGDDPGPGRAAKSPIRS
jgi:MHS family proline/betaine transporter-like MFS transporter